MLGFQNWDKMVGKMRTLSIKIIFFTNYRKYAVTRNYKNPVFYGVREKQVSAFSGSREDGAGRGNMEEECWWSPRAALIKKSCKLNYERSIMEEESWRRLETGAWMLDNEG